MMKLKLSKPLLLITLLSLNLNSKSQDLNKLELGASFGTKNLGVFATYKMFQNLDFVGGIDLMRFNNINYNLRVRNYPLKKFNRKKFCKGAIYLGLGYKATLKSTYTYVDKSNFETIFVVPEVQYLLSEIGFRYNFKYKSEEEYINLNGKYFHLDMSFGITYLSKLNNSISSVKTGMDRDNRLKKINQFLDSGLGFQLGFHVMINRRKHNSN